MAAKKPSPELEKIKKALKEAGLGDLLLDRHVGAIMACDEACYAGCSKCCSSGTANRAFESIA